MNSFAPPETVTAQDPPPRSRRSRKAQRRPPHQRPNPDGVNHLRSHLRHARLHRTPLCNRRCDNYPRRLKLAPEIDTPSMAFPEGQTQPAPGTVIAQTRQPDTPSTQTPPFNLQSFGSWKRYWLTRARPWVSNSGAAPIRKASTSITPTFSGFTVKVFRR